MSYDSIRIIFFSEAENELKVSTISSRQPKAAKASSCLRGIGNTDQYFFMLQGQSKRAQVSEFGKQIYMIILYVQEVLTHFVYCALHIFAQIYTENHATFPYK